MELSGRAKRESNYRACVSRGSAIELKKLLEYKVGMAVEMALMNSPTGKTLF